MEFEKPELKIGEMYSVNVYPTEEVVEAKYLGEHMGITHSFGGEGFYVKLLDRFIIEDEGIITHNPVSSISAFKYDFNISKNLREFLEAQN